jgi:hypothetical protein
MDLPGKAPVKLAWSHDGKRLASAEDMRTKCHRCPTRRRGRDKLRPLMRETATGKLERKSPSTKKSERRSYDHTTHKQHHTLPRMQRADGRTRLEMPMRQVQVVFPAQLYAEYPGAAPHFSLRQALVPRSAPPGDARPAIAMTSA